MSDLKYTVTIYAAAPGTPFYEKGKPKLDDKGNPETSVPGHMYYAISDGSTRESYGFAPKEHGSVNGPGGVTSSDERTYHKPFYARTIEVTREQYDQLREFGKKPWEYGFDMQYRDARNNCIDFTWAGLNHAGLKRTEKSMWTNEAHEVDGKLNYLPANNDDSIKTIRDPVPGSPLNREERHPMPEMRWWQRGFLTENEMGQPGGPLASHGQPIQVASAAVMPPAASNDDPFEQLARASASGDDSAFSAVAQSYLRGADGRDVMAAGREANRQQDGLRQQEHAALQQSQPATPSVSMRV
ncbi:MAG: hypothetical protein EON54_20610 [Alcaligenaceae bacterium]|nr:MAG: hypothetical protein EON54_20610 [Alcaligenaceae bacterium]